MPQPSKTLYGLAGVGVLGIIIAIYAANSSDPERTDSKSARPDPSLMSSAARDSQVNTLAVLTADIQRTKQSNAALMDQNQQLDRQNRQLMENVQAMKDRTGNLEQQFRSLKRHPQLAKLNEYERMLQEQLEGRSTVTTPELESSAEETPRPLNVAALPATAAGYTPPLGSVLAVPTLNPFKLSEKSGPTEEFMWRLPAHRQLEESNPKDRGTGLSANPLTQTPSRNDKAIPKFTINPLATNFDAVAMTALVGRIPVGGRSEDPYRAKILIGRDSLAANGIFMEGLEGMLVGGWAVGDWALSCVDVKLDSYAFIFDDGTISAQEPGKTDKIGYISMPNGFPCVPGKFHSNAMQFLGQQTFLSGLQAAGAAYSASQTSQEDLPLGGSRTTVTGSTEKYVIGQVAQNSVDETIKWLIERQQNSFDAVVTEPGVQVSVHFEKQIEINYDPQGRMIAHDRKHRSMAQAMLD